MTDPNITEVKPFHEQQVLWPLTTGYTLLYFAMMVVDFALRDAFTMPVGMMSLPLKNPTEEGQSRFL